MKNIDKIDELNENIQSGHCRLMVNKIIFQMTNYSGPCIFNGKLEEKGK